MNNKCNHKRCVLATSIVPTSAGILRGEATLMDGEQEGEFTTSLWSIWGLRSDNDDEEYIRFWTKSIQSARNVHIVKLLYSYSNKASQFDPSILTNIKL